MRSPALFTSFLALLLAFTPAFSQAPAEKDELTKLREENQRLRQLLIQRQAAATPAPATYRAPVAVPQSVPVATQPQGLTHWITSSTSKRHNSGCRYFKNSNGWMYSDAEGTACKICGG